MFALSTARRACSHEPGRRSDFKVAATSPDHLLIQAFLEQPGPPRAIDLAGRRRIRHRLLTADREADGAARLAHRHTQGNDVVQGGILAVLLDFGIAFAVLTRLPPGGNAGTVTLTTQFLRAAGPGPCVVSGRVERLGPHVIRRALLDAEGKEVIATATAVMAVQLSR
jgi:acyl-coenzyme A thioesterase PaaI-like protein